MYTPLHLHTAVGSLLDSMVNIPDLMTRLKDLNFESCSITDHGNMMGVIEFYQNCIKNNIKPIIGMEAYYTPDCHSRKTNGFFSNKQLEKYKEAIENYDFIKEESLKFEEKVKNKLYDK